MAYTHYDYQSKKALRDAIKLGVRVTCYQPGPFASTLPKDGKVYLEGPHYPKPHKWYAEGILRDGILISIK
jgi:hypothetical protein